MLHTIKEVIQVSPYRITLLFNTGETRVIDLEEKIRSRSQSPESKYRDLLDPDYFQSVQLEPEWETIYWENGLDFCPDVLYSMGVDVSENSVDAKVC